MTTDDGPQTTIATGDTNAATTDDGRRTRPTRLALRCVLARTVTDVYREYASLSGVMFLLSEDGAEFVDLALDRRDGESEGAPRLLHLVVFDELEVDEPFEPGRTLRLLRFRKVE